MEAITALWAWVLAHQVELWTALGGLWTAVSIIVRLTPSPWDDEQLSKVRALLERVSFLQPHNLPGLLSVPTRKANRKLKP